MDYHFVLDLTSAIFCSVGAYDMSTLVTEALKELCNYEEACKLCLCHDSIMTTLLSPIYQLLEESYVRAYLTNEWTWLKFSLLNEFMERKEK